MVSICTQQAGKLGGGVADWVEGGTRTSLFNFTYFTKTLINHKLARKQR